MKDVVDYYFDDEFTVWLNHLFIDSAENPGLPLGNQVNQKYALLLLHSLDHTHQQELADLLRTLLLAIGKDQTNPMQP